MISLGVARKLQARLAAGEEIVFNAEIRAHLREGRYALVSAVIPGAVTPGADPELATEEIVYSCHLDHPRPGANDNASGCVSILEAARVLKRLITLGTLPPPRRSLRFIWPAEIEGSIIYLSSLDSTAHIKANIHLDMVGGGAVTKSVFRISDPLVSIEGSKNPQLALMEGIDLGSDHQVFNEGSFGIPGTYLHDWPDRYIHTNFDQAANIDPTKLKRAAFIAALQGWYLANFDADDVAPVLALLRANALARARDLMLELPSLNEAQQAAVLGVHWEVERQKVASLGDFASLSGGQKQISDAFIAGLSGLVGISEIEATGSANDERVYRRNPDIKGPMHAFGYSYLEDHLPADEYAGLKLSGVLAYEALNLVDGNRTVGEIRHWLLAECRAQCRVSSGWLEPGDVAAYLAALEKIGVVL